MSHLDSDLEEGEILDSPPSPAINNNKKCKELPRRYDVRENKNNIHKHKKDCKYAIRHHAKKLSKLKTPPKKSHKNYHKYTCSRKKSHKYSSSDIQKSSFSKNGHSFPQHSLIAEMQTSIKCLNINKQSTKSVYEKTQLKKQSTAISKNDLGPFEKLNIKTPKTDFNSYISNEKSLNAEIHPHNSTSEENKQHSTNAKEIGVMKQNVDSKNGDIIPNGSLEAKDQESEDEEELRRIALATCAKRIAIIKPSENVHKSCSIPVPEISNSNDVQILHETGNPASDNYEVVDMEIDDTEDSGEIIQTAIENQPSESSENLFIIDTNPSVDIVGNKENSYIASEVANNSSDEDFEADILRAELIESMYRKKYIKDEQMQKSKFSLHKKPKPVVPEKKFLVNYQKPNLSYHHKVVRTAKHTLRKNPTNKSGNLKNIQNKVPLSVQAHKPPERLIIALNDESSSDESDKCEDNLIAKNPVESIVALISDCRQKSDSTAETKSSDVETKAVPKAVACLSKAQQEEYNSLMKILAEKKKLPVAHVTHPQKNGSLHPPIDDLKQLEGKLVGLKDTLKNKKESVTSLSKEINSKKLLYMKAKLTTQHLKEQLIAAEKVRKAKLLEWSRSCDHLKLMKKSVSDLENKIGQVQSLCNKIGLSVQGQSYKLPV